MSNANNLRLTADTNIIKTRDDHQPVAFERAEVPDATEQQSFKLVGDSSCNWVRPAEAFGTKKLRERIEPWLTSLCQSEHFSMLLGSGLSNAVHMKAAGSLLPGMAKGDFGQQYNEVIFSEAKRAARRCGRNEGNIEDQLRVANEIHRTLEIYAANGHEESQSNVALLGASIEGVLKSFAESVYAGERGIAQADPAKRNDAFNYLVSFLMSFASRSGTRDRLHLFTTNYDRVIEAGADVAGMHLLDRFVGSVSPIFRSSRLDLDIHYNPPGIRGEPRYLEGVARMTKLHGSLDWIDTQQNIQRIGLPFGGVCNDLVSSAFAEIGESSKQLMVFPNAAKDRETTFYPYTELFRDFASALCRPNHTLVTFGYGFGDDHLNRVIEDMLTVPSTHLVVISWDDPLGRIMSTYERLGRPSQVSLLLGNHVGEFSTLVDHYLPKPAIDRTTFRMAELLRARFGAKTAEPDPEPIELSDQATEVPASGDEAAQ